MLTMGPVIRQFFLVTASVYQQKNGDGDVYRSLTVVNTPCYETAGQSDSIQHKIFYAPMHNNCHDCLRGECQWKLTLLSKETHHDSNSNLDQM